MSKISTKSLTNCSTRSDWTIGVVNALSSFTTADEAYESSRSVLCPTETLQIRFALLRFNPISGFGVAKNTTCLRIWARPFCWITNEDRIAIQRPYWECFCTWRGRTVGWEDWVSWFHNLSEIGAIRSLLEIEEPFGKWLRRWREWETPRCTLINIKYWEFPTMSCFHPVGDSLMMATATITRKKTCSWHKLYLCTLSANILCFVGMNFVRTDELFSSQRCLQSDAIEHWYVQHGCTLWCWFDGREETWQS